MKIRTFFGSSLKKDHRAISRYLCFGFALLAIEASLVSEALGFSVVIINDSTISVAPAFGCPGMLFPGSSGFNWIIGASGGQVAAKTIAISSEMPSCDGKATLVFDNNENYGGYADPVNGYTVANNQTYVYRFGSATIVDPNDMRPCTERCCGMAKWEVSEPYITLWLRDEPLGYQPALGPRVSFELAFKQREFMAGWNPSVFSVGRRWNLSWLSYVAQDWNTNKVVFFPGGGSRTYASTNDYLTNTRLTGDTTNGFTLLHPDGSQDIYGFIVTNSSGAFLNAFLTERWNAQSQKMRLNYYSYAPGAPVIRLQSIIDGDGRTNSIYYATNNAFNTNLISQVVDPFGRSTSLAYDNAGRLTNIVDVAGIFSSFLYDTNSDYVTNLTTSYGTTAFTITDSTGTNVTPNGRSVLVTQPDGGKQLWLYQDNATGVADSFSTNGIPGTASFGNTFDTNNLSVRNTFYWGPRQYANLLPTSLSALTTNQVRGARMKHWLASSSALVGSTLSMEREPSPDSGGTVEGQKIWYDYDGKTNSAYEGAQVSPLFVAQVLPDGTTRFTRSQRNNLGAVTNEVITYSSP